MQDMFIFLWVCVAMATVGVWESSVEGRKPWDKGKEGWKISFRGYTVLTRYHFWLFWVTLPMLLMLPIIVFGFDLHLFGVLCSAYLIGVVIEDFVWFLANPHYGVLRWNSKEVTWYPWVGVGAFQIPLYYILTLAVAVLVYWLTI
ncbi:hypothetical protein H6504_02820 [Candidatus Woesearchaeota archaeon]|nr:hypothetical protein [Candidatus Woesearchaeota archaeon]